jgi:hypothetical protein
MTELTFIDLNERVYKYIRQFTIKSVEDAAVELITNCVDAYNKGNILPRKIEIEYDDKGIFKVRDHAIGLTGSDMQKCFLQVGDYTNIDGARGFFSRGAKDISAIGDITFHAIKDNLYSRVFLNSDAYGRIEVIDEPADNSIRESIGLLSGNGLLVEMKLLPNFYLSNASDEADSYSKLGVLRDIMSDSNNIINFIHTANGSVIFNRHLTYNYPPATLLLELTYNVPNYNGITAEFVVFKTDKPIIQPKKENEMQFGFTIKDTATIYEVSTIDDRFRWNPYMSYVYGYLKCDHIGILLREYDTNGSTALNPLPLIDPSRLTGVNKQHPFIISLLSIPKVRLDQILRELNTSVSSQSISLSEVGDLFSELEKYGLNIVDDEEIKMTFVPSYDAQLAKAIEDDRMNFVTSEKNYLLTANYNITQTETDKYIMEELNKLPTTEYKYVAGDNGELIQIPNTTIQDSTSTVDLLNKLDDETINAITKRPYIYSLTSDGKLVKLYIFEKGRLEQISNPENEYVIIKNKKFSISFINDINLQQRYIINHDNGGVNVKLNIHNSMIKKYLVSDRVLAGATELSVGNMTSTKSLIFLKDLMIEILAEIIVENDIINNKLILDSNNYNNMKKILTHRNLIVNKVEDPLEFIFDKFINNNYLNKSTQINSLLDSISGLVSQKIDMAHEGGEIVLLKTQLDSTITNILE